MRCETGIRGSPIGGSCGTRSIRSTATDRPDEPAGQAGPKIGKIKETNGVRAYDPVREEEVLARAVEHNRGPLSNHCLKAVLSRIDQRLAGARKIAARGAPRPGLYVQPFGGDAAVWAERRIRACREHRRGVRGSESRALRLRPRADRKQHRWPHCRHARYVHAACRCRFAAK